MLQNLSIKNYTLIDDLELTFGSGMTTITGETGSGKSIILGALGLTLGNRADLQTLRNNEEKCIIEAVFIVEDSLTDFFDAHDLDFSNELIIRREILPSGKSRAFVNDTPTRLDVLSELGNHLIDIHSQDHNRLLAAQPFRLGIIDKLADHGESITEYQQAFSRLAELNHELKELTEGPSGSAHDLDYLQFQLNELEAANLENTDAQSLENELQLLSNAGEVKTKLEGASTILTESDDNLEQHLNHLSSELQKYSEVDGRIAEFVSRLESVRIELMDLSSEIVNFSSELNLDPQRMEEVQGRLDELYRLEQKHRVQGTEELIRVKNEIDDTIQGIESQSERIDTLKFDLKQVEETSRSLALAISQSRVRVIPALQKLVTEVLTEVGLEAARFEVELERTESLTHTGSDTVQFLFNANPGEELKPLEKVASGGEYSRLMLALKSCFSRISSLPTLVLDEIDTGVSGEIARKVGRVMKRMGREMQLVTITHLPQIASLADHHFKVSKSSTNNITETTVDRLGNEDRVQEIAGMLSGDTSGDAAVENARELLNEVI